ncbi:MAG TPA: RHS repeat-associated core domain-containing protein, partial [Trebonia sp.]|nr:RHS repeat-associated core domain-containing protein [Trebonia sp.]
VMPGTDVTQTATGTGISESLTLHSADVATSWVFPLKLTGLTASLDGGSVDLKDAAGKVVWVISPAVARSGPAAAGSGRAKPAAQASSELAYRLVTDDGGPALEMTLSKSWLEARGRVFPVVVDPTVYPGAWGSSYTLDYNGTPQTQNNEDAEYLPSGTATFSGDTYQSYDYLAFDGDLEDEMPGAQITSASLYLFDVWADQCSSPITVDADQVTQSWFPTDSLTYPGPSYGTQDAAWTGTVPSDACSDDAPEPGLGGWIGLNFNSAGVALLNDWTTETGPADDGFALVSSQTNAAQGTEFDSSNETDVPSSDGGDCSGSCNPFLEVNYTVNSGPVPNGTSLSFPISDRASLSVNVGTGNALLTTSDITLPQTSSPLTLGMAYNSLLAGAGVTGDTGAYGWTTEQGSDVSLYPASDGSMTFIGPDGTTGTFTPDSGGGYSSPPVFPATLAESSGSTCGGTGWTLTWNDTGEVMCFNSTGAITSEADRDGNTTSFAYNSDGKETSVTYTPEGASAPTETVNALRSSSGGDLTGYTESGGSAGTKTVTYNFDSSTGNLSSIVQPDGTTISFGYDSSNDLTSITNGDNVTTTLTYNSSHQVTSVTQPYGSSGGTATTRLSYVSPTETQVATPNTNQSEPVASVPNITYTIDPTTSLVTKVVNEAGDTESDTYTPFDDVATSTNAVGGVTTNTYGANSGESLTESESPTGSATYLAYDNADNATDPTASFQPSSSTDGQGNVTAYIYNGAGNELQATNALAAAAKVTYNSDGTPATSTDPDGAETTYGYNADHQLTTVTPPTSGSLKPETVTYDGFGRVATVTNGNGDTVTYTYDMEDRILKEAYTGPSAPVTVTYSYDGAGNLKTQTGPSGTTTYTYDGRNTVLTHTATSGGGTLSYGYDADGNMTSATDAGGTTTYAYNDLDQLTSLTDPDGLLWEFAYNADGQRTTTWMNTNSTESTWAGKTVTGYDAAGRITRIQAYNGESSSDVVSDTSYCYSPYVSGTACPTSSATTDTSLLQYSVNNQTGAVTKYSYDDADRLAAATNDNAQNYSYGYDADGNLTSGAGAGSLNYNASNQITTSGYAYDGAGNLTSDPANGTLTYNDAGQLTSASSAAGGGSGAGSETFSYAGASQDEPLNDGSATDIVYGLPGQGGEPQVDSYNIGGQTDYIIRDPQGDPLGMIRGGETYMFVTDNVGSVTGIIDYNGSTAATYSYTPYGQITSADSGAGIAEDNLIGYTGALTDTSTAGSTGYVHDGNRWYDPATGTFTAQDADSYLTSFANGNRYAYAADNPANYIDPTGQDIWGDLAAGVVTVAGTVLGVAAVVVDIPVITVAAAVIGVAALGIYVYQMECSYGGAGSMWTIPGQCTVF